MFTIYLWKEINSQIEKPGRPFWLAITMISFTVLFMATGRHIYRERAVDPHRQMMKAKTEAFYWQSVGAQTRERLGISKQKFDSKGQQYFEANCSACHVPETTLIGPPIKEMIEIYHDDIDGFVQWTMNPGVKRGGVVMPPFAHLGEEKLREIADYVMTNFSAPKEE
jgi:cytochrome c